MPPTILQDFGVSSSDLELVLHQFESMIAFRFKKDPPQRVIAVDAPLADEAWRTPFPPPTSFSPRRVSGSSAGAFPIVVFDIGSAAEPFSDIRSVQPFITDEHGSAVEKLLLTIRLIVEDRGEEWKRSFRKEHPDPHDEAVIGFRIECGDTFFSDQFLLSLTWIDARKK